MWRKSVIVIVLFCYNRQAKMAIITIIISKNGDFYIIVGNGDYNQLVKALPEVDGYCNCFIIIVKIA